MNRRIRKKKEKQRQEQEKALVLALSVLLDTAKAGEREYWRQWEEESARRFAETVCRRYEQQHRKEGLQH